MTGKGSLGIREQGPGTRDQIPDRIKVNRSSVIHIDNGCFFVIRQCEENAKIFLKVIRIRYLYSG